MEGTLGGMVTHLTNLMTRWIEEKVSSQLE